MNRAIAFALVLALNLTLTAQPASADYGWLGSGKWPSASLKYHFYGSVSDYQSATSYAADEWSWASDLTVTSVPEGYENIGLGPGNWGATTWDARTIICTASQCYSFAPINETYNYAQIDFNTFRMDGKSWSAKTAIASHEFGHSFSLAHVTTCNPDHIMFVNADDPCNGSKFGPQEHDIIAVNYIY